MKSEIILRKNQYAIDSAARELRDNLQQAQEYVEWYNSIEFTEPLKGIEAVKKFLDNPHSIYEQDVKKHLQELTGLKTLPPEIDQLKAMYKIPEPQAWSVSDKLGFDFLQIDENGQLFYSQEIYDRIESEATRYATPEEVSALIEIERTWLNLEKISEALFPEPGISRRMWYDEVTQPLSSTLRHHRPGHTDDPSLLTPWKIEAIERLAASGFGQPPVVQKKTKI